MTSPKHNADAAVDYVTQNLPALADGLTGVVPGQVSAEADIADAVHDAWLVVEAIPERLELKKQIFGQLDELAAADAILASNSSSYASRHVLGQGPPPRTRAEHSLLHAAETECRRRHVVRQDRPRRHRLRAGDVAAVRAVPVRSAQGEHRFHLQPGMGSGESGSRSRSSPKACPHRRKSTGCFKSTPAPPPAPSG